MEMEKKGGVGWGSRVSIGEVGRCLVEIEKSCGVCR